MKKYENILYILITIFATIFAAFCKIISPGWLLLLFFPVLLIFLLSYLITGIAFACKRVKTISAYAFYYLSTLSLVLGFATIPEAGDSDSNYSALSMLLAKIYYHDYDKYYGFYEFSTLLFYTSLIVFVVSLAGLIITNCKKYKNIDISEG